MYKRFGTFTISLLLLFAPKSASAAELPVDPLMAHHQTAVEVGLDVPLRCSAPAKLCVRVGYRNGLRVESDSEDLSLRLTQAEADYLSQTVGPYYHFYGEAHGRNATRVALEMILSRRKAGTAFRARIAGFSIVGVGLFLLGLGILRRDR